MIIQANEDMINVVSMDNFQSTLILCFSHPMVTIIGFYVKYGVARYRILNVVRAAFNIHKLGYNNEHLHVT